MLTLDGPDVGLLPQVALIDSFAGEDGRLWVARMDQLTPWRIHQEVGDWPYTAMATIRIELPNGPLWGVATFTEGDIHVTSYDDFSTFRQAKIDTAKFWHDD